MKRVGKMGWMEELVELIEVTQKKWSYPLPHLHPLFYHNLILSIIPPTSSSSSLSSDHLNNLIYLLTWITSHSQKPSIIIFTGLIANFDCTIK